MSIKNKLFCTVQALSAIVLLASAVYAEAPNLFTYQGRLKEGGQAVSANRTVEIKLCPVEIGGSCETTGAQSVAVLNGLFRSTFTIPAAVNFGTGGWWLEIKVGADTLAPRERLTSNAYSLFSATAAYAENISAAAGSDGVYISSNLFVSGNNFTVGGSTLSVDEGKVGIGTLNPAGALEIYRAGSGQTHLVLNNPSSDVALFIKKSALRGILGMPYYDERVVLTNKSAPFPGIADPAITLWDDGHMDLKVYSTGYINLTGGNVGLSSATPGYRLVVSSGAGEAGNMLVISTGSSNVIRLTGAGQIYANYYYGDGSGLTGVTATGLADGSVTSAKIADANVTDAKIAGMSASKLTGALPAIDGSALTNLPVSGGAMSLTPAASQTVTYGAAGVQTILKMAAAATVDPLDIQDSAAASIFKVSKEGNMTLAGTVDGRDIAIDGATLDGLNTGAEIIGLINADPALIDDDNIAATMARDSEISAAAVSAVEGEATLDLTGDVTVAATKSLAVDTINEKTAAAGVTIDGVLIKDGAIGQAVVGLASVANVAQLPASYLDTDNTLAADSDAKVASQKAIKAFVATGLSGKLALAGDGSALQNIITSTAAIVTTLGVKYDAVNFVAGTNYLTPAGNGSGLTGVITSTSAIVTALGAKYEAANFVAGTNYLVPAGDGSALTGVITSTAAIVGALAGKVGLSGDEAIAGLKVFTTTVSVNHSVLVKGNYSLMLSTNIGYGGGLRHDQSGNETMVMAVRNANSKIYLATGYDVSPNAGGALALPASPEITVFNGMVGIKEPSPGYALDVTGQVNATGGLCIGADCKASWLSVDNLGDHTATQALNMADRPINSISTASLNGIIISSGTGSNYFAGKVGIGTASPSDKLNVVGGNVVLEKASGDMMLSVKTGASANAAEMRLGSNNLAWSIGHSGDASSHKLSFQYYNGAWSTPAVLTTDGKFGIGTIAPANPLEVNGVIKSLTGGFTFPDGTNMTTAAGVGTGYASATDITMAADTDGNGTGILTFATKGSERMRVDNDGNVGVGLAAPATRLDVQAAAAGSSVQIWRDSGGTIVASMTATGLVAARGVKQGVQELSLSGAVSTFAADGSGVVLITQTSENNNIVTITGCDSGVVAQGQQVLLIGQKYTAGSVGFIDTPVASVAADNMVLVASFSMGGSINRGTTLTLVCTTINDVKAWVEVASTQNGD